MEYQSVGDDAFNLFTADTFKREEYKYNLCDACGDAMIIDPQRGTYTCDSCNSQKSIVGGIDDFAQGSSSIIRMQGSKSTIKHRSGKDTTETIGNSYYKKFVKLNAEYVKFRITKSIEREKQLRASESFTSKESEITESSLSTSDADYYRGVAKEHGVDDSFIDLIEITHKTSRIPDDILSNVARTYAEIFMYSRKKEYDENGVLLETRESRNRGKKLWGLIAYLFMQECAKRKFPLDSDEAIIFVSPQQKDVSVTKGERIARDLNSNGNLELTQLNTTVSDERIEKKLKILGLDQSQFDRYIGFVRGIMKTVRDEGVGIRTIEKTQIIGSIYIIIKQLGFKIDADTIAKKCEIQAKTFTSFHDSVMENVVIFNHIFARYKIKSGLEGKLVKRKK